MKDAEFYAGFLGESDGRVRERMLFSMPEHLREIEIQSRWFAGDFGRKFTSAAGDEIEIVQFGVWNREAGPDFSDAAVSINGGTPVRGCIELDLEARDWERHGHGTNPDYEPVVLHLFMSRRGEAEFFTRTAGNRNVPQVRLDAGGLGPATSNPVPVATPGRCSSVLRDLPPEEARAILRGAAQYRMQKKAARLARLAEIHGEDEALFQSLATTLGYKGNKLPFTLLAQRVPLRVLLQNRPDAEAILFGMSGFLDAADLSGFDVETRAWLRDLWDRWWSRRTGFERLALARSEWCLAGQRPVNHPQRRIGALAQMVGLWPKIRALSKRCGVPAIRDFFAGLSGGYWDHHYTLTSPRSKKPMALVGNERVNGMLANVFFPIAILSDPERWEEYEKLPAMPGSRRVRIAALRLLGGGTQSSKFFRTVWGQEGLLQVYEDFCMQDASGCANCLFPAQIAARGRRV